MDGLLVLSVFHVTKLFIVGVPLEQEVAHFPEPIVGSIVEGGPLAHITRVDVGA